MMIYSGELNTWNAAHALNHIHDFTSFSSSPSSLTPSPHPLSLSLSLALPPGHTGSDSTPLGSRAYAGATRPAGRGRALPCFPQRYEGMTHVWRIARERQREIWIGHLESECRLINVQRICNIYRSQEQRILGNRGWVTDYWDSTETKYW